VWVAEPFHDRSREDRIPWTRVYLPMISRGLLVTDLGHALAFEQRLDYHVRGRVALDASGAVDRAHPGTPSQPLGVGGIDRQAAE